VKYDPFFALVPWQPKLTDLSRDRNDVMYGATSCDDKDRSLGLNFLTYGFRNVGEYLEFIHKHRVALQGTV